MVLNHRKPLLSLLILVLGLTSLYGQLAPQLVQANSPAFSHQYTLAGNDHYYFIDTSFNSLHWYHQFNQANRDLFGYARLGNMGAPLNPLTTPANLDLWENISLGAYQPYFKRRQDIPIYSVRSPLTEATYWMGYERGQSFNFYHTQNINERWNFMVNFKNLNATGDYLRDFNSHFTFLANTHYKNEDWGYEFYAHILTEKITNQENGGIASDSLFEVNAVTAQPRSLMAVNLPSDRRVVRSRKFLLHQDLDLFHLLQPRDSLGNKPKLNAYFKLGHQFRWSRKAMTYRGNTNSDFYNNYFFDDGIYNDSIGYQAFENTVFIKTEVGKTTKVALKVGLRNLVTSYGNDFFNLTGSNLGLVSELKAQISERFKVVGELDYIFLGPLNQSLQVGANAHLEVYKSLKLIGGFNLQVRNPSFFHQTYYSNNFIWLNDFEKEVNTSFSAGLAWGTGNFVQLSNHTFASRVFYNSDALPEQSADLVNVIKLSLRQNFILWGFLHQDNDLFLQQSDNDRVMPLPEFNGRHSLYFTYQLFEGALSCQTGAEVNYFSSFQSPSYNPATGDFFNAAEREIGNYPLVDVFANFKLRKTIFFVKLEHMNQGLAAYNYYAAPHYPFPDRSIRVGISWRFFN